MFILVVFFLLYFLQWVVKTRYAIGMQIEFYFLINFITAYACLSLNFDFLLVLVHLSFI